MDKAISVWVSNSNIVTVRGNVAALEAEVARQFPSMTVEQIKAVCVGRFVSAW